MDIHFSSEEANHLTLQLKLRLQELESELVRTDDRNYRADLKQSIEQLETIIARFNDSFPELKKTA